MDFSRILKKIPYFLDLERREIVRRENFTVAKKKIQTLEVFMDLVKKQREIDFDMISVFYRDLFVRSVEKVMVIVRINKIIQEYGDKNRIHQFVETEESILYRKFLNTWEGYWEEETVQMEKGKKKRRLWIEQVRARLSQNNCAGSS